MKKMEYANQRVLLSKQLVEVFACPESRIKDNFRHHKALFTQGEHFFKVSGEQLRQFRKENPTAEIGKFAVSLLLWTKCGTGVHCDLINTPEARAAFAALERDYFDDVQSPTMIEGVHCYIDANQIAWLNAEDVARGLGFVEAKKFSTSGENYVRWERVNGYLREFAPFITDKNLRALIEKGVGLGDFIPENLFYLLAMKANNETAKKFQWKVASEILPTLRRQGYYSFKDDKKAEEEMASVYGMKMSNNLVKIGSSGDVERRIPEVERDSGWNVVDEHHTKKMPVKRARHEEKRLHRKYSAVKVNGEYFNVDFEFVKEELDCIEISASEGFVPYEDKKLLVELCHIVPNSPLQENLIKETANLLFDKKIF